MLHSTQSPPEKQRPYYDDEEHQQEQEVEEEALLMMGGGTTQPRQRRTRDWPSWTTTMNNNNDEDYGGDSWCKSSTRSETNTDAMFSQVRRPNDDDTEEDDFDPANKGTVPGIRRPSRNGDKDRRSWSRRMWSQYKYSCCCLRGGGCNCIFPSSNSNRCCSSSRCCWKQRGSSASHSFEDENVVVLSEDTTYEEVEEEEDAHQQSWDCSFGTSEHDGIWMNTTDRVGTMIAALVWVLILYSVITMLVLCSRNHIRPAWTAIYATLATLALACHAKTTFTDPGAVPSSAVPLQPNKNNNNKDNNNNNEQQLHVMCGICLAYKPKTAHHCRVCNRCIAGMDHHCPWMNNCIGVSNMKHFTLFLMYTWAACAMALVIFLVNYFFCHELDCEFSPLEIHLVRIMSFLCTAAWFFTSNMLMSVMYGFMTGMGVVDRRKREIMGTMHLADEQPVPLEHVVGHGPCWTWFLPTDPVFLFSPEEYDAVLGFTTPQRLLREYHQLAMQAQRQTRHDHHNIPQP